MFSMQSSLTPPGFPYPDRAGTRVACRFWGAHRIINELWAFGTLDRVCRPHHFDFPGVSGGPSGLLPSRTRLAPTRHGKWRIRHFRITLLTQILHTDIIHLQHCWVYHPGSGAEKLPSLSRVVLLRQGNKFMPRLTRGEIPDSGSANWPSWQLSVEARTEAGILVNSRRKLALSVFSMIPR